ncbi:MAG: isoleucine--tRNA ligase [Candidatus Ancillula sp.]|jgi:isoleucyl-tRNA synthetase|nr:isoleucine--tRNA ligase [Candidatus Ancillula sp.]
MVSKFPKVTSAPDTSVAGLKSSPNFPDIEKHILEDWKKNSTFKKSVEQNSSGDAGSNEFVFYDGPPFANGLPHYGHLLTGYVKDVIPRFETMLGRRVDRRFGWDTHGLPAELSAQKELGINSPEEIKEMGLEKFNNACRDSVLRYTAEWEKYVTRQARWVDFENDYKTLNVEYMESVIWAFKQLYDKGLAYKGYKVLPYCWNDQTPLSNHELGMDADVYRDKQDNTVTLALRIDTSFSSSSAQAVPSHSHSPVDLETNAHYEPQAGTALRIDTSSPAQAVMSVMSGKEVYALVWTTTPWTLPTNFAIAVGPEINYVLVTPKAGDFAGKSFIIAESRVAAHLKEFTDDVEIEHLGTGKDLEGLPYFPAFDYFPRNFDAPDVNLNNAYQVHCAEYVGDGDGTGLVHIAPYGEDDMLVLNELKVVPPVPMTPGAVFTSEVSDYSTLHVFDANKPILDDFKNATGSQDRIDPKKRALLFKTQSIAHSYPHCWRCRKPLIYRPISSWYVAVTEIKPRLLELNKKINWIPANVRDGQFGKWLENARDWAISRNRFWGSPIPIWVSDNPDFPRTEVYGSLEELNLAFADCLKNDPDCKKAYPDGKVNNLHRPYVDTLWRPNPNDPSGKSKMKRIEDVFDCWFESGSMSFAQVHYPFENKQWFEEHFPADFIVEYIGQTRGWFYLMHVMATALFDCNAFKNVMCHGIVLGDDGQKMSKSLQNYPDVNEVFDKYGSDAMRWFLMSSNILNGGNLIVKEEAIKDAVRNILLPLWSSYYFFCLYVNSAKTPIEVKRLEPRNLSHIHVQDRYILAKIRTVVDNMTTSLKGFEIQQACEEVRGFLDILTNWYIRTQRNRFWDEDEYAFNTLWTVLEFLTRAIAPLLPLTAEEIWRGLTGKESVHLEPFPAVDVDRNAAETLLVDEVLVAQVDTVRDIISTTLNLRVTADMRVRQPLHKLTLVLHDTTILADFEEVVKSELNVKELEVLGADDVSEADYGLIHKLNVNARALGPRIGKRVQEVIKSSKNGAWKIADGTPVVELDDGPFALEDGEYTLETVLDESKTTGTEVAAMLNLGGFVVLDVALTQNLIDEGIARDLVREIQQLRKDSGLEVTDRITLSLRLKVDRAAAVNKFKKFIMDEVLAVELSLTEAEDEKILPSLAL